MSPRRLSWLLMMILLNLNLGSWAHAVVAQPVAPAAEHCAHHEQAPAKPAPAHTDCCKLDAGGCSCLHASAMILPVFTRLSFQGAGTVPVAYAVQPHSADPSAFFRPPI